MATAIMEPKTILWNLVVGTSSLRTEGDGSGGGQKKRKSVAWIHAFTPLGACRVREYYQLCQYAGRLLLCLRRGPAAPPSGHRRLPPYSTDKARNV